MLEMNTIRPRRSRIIPLLARRAQRKAAARLVSMTLSNSSSLMRMSSWSAVMPALATRTSTGPPSSSSALAKAASTEAVSVTSQMTPCNPSGGSPERWVMTTWSPASARARAMHSPMPRLPPVTSTFRPCAMRLLCSKGARSPAGGPVVTLADYRSVVGIERGLSLRHGPLPPPAPRPACGRAVRHDGTGVAGGRAGRAHPPLPVHDGHPDDVLRPGGGDQRLGALDVCRAGRGAAVHRRRARQCCAPPERWTFRDGAAGPRPHQADRALMQALVCSAKGCRSVAAWAHLWNNPKLHTADRRKVWLACEELRVTLGEFLSVRGFLIETVPAGKI